MASWNPNKKKDYKFSPGFSRKPYKSQYYGQTEAQREAALKNLEKANAARARNKEIRELRKKYELFEMIEKAISVAASASNIDKRDIYFKEYAKMFHIEGDFETGEDFDNPYPNIAEMGALIAANDSSKLKELNLNTQADFQKAWEEYLTIKEKIKQLNLTENEYQYVIGLSDELKH
jgi:hypothetical protein